VSPQSEVKAEKGWAVVGLGEASHFGIQVLNLERSLEFYRDLLGLEQIAHWVRDEDYNQKIVGYPGVTLNIAVMRLPKSETFMEIIEYQNVERTPVDTRTANPGTAHIAFYVDDLDETYARLTAAGVRSVSEVVEATRDLPGAKAVYMMDPDGIRVEFLESPMTLAGERRK
jgi:lactoylglutathione lyase